MLRTNKSAEGGSQTNNISVAPATRRKLERDMIRDNDNNFLVGRSTTSSYPPLKNLESRARLGIREMGARGINLKK